MIDLVNLYRGATLRWGISGMADSGGFLGGIPKANGQNFSKTRRAPNTQGEAVKIFEEFWN
jgi:hypothetical protein